MDVADMDTGRMRHMYLKVDMPKHICQESYDFYVAWVSKSKYAGVQKRQIPLLYSLDPCSCAFWCTWNSTLPCPSDKSLTHSEQRGKWSWRGFKVAQMVATLCFMFQSKTKPYSQIQHCHLWMYVFFCLTTRVMLKNLCSLSSEWSLSWHRPCPSFLHLLNPVPA